MVLSQPTNLLAHQKKSQKIKLTNIIEFDLCFFVCYTNTFGFVWNRQPHHWNFIAIFGKYDFTLWGVDHIFQPDPSIILAHSKTKNMHSLPYTYVQCMILSVGWSWPPSPPTKPWLGIASIRFGGFIGAWYWPRGRSSSVGSIRPGSGAGELEPGRAKPRGEAEESRRMRSRANGGEARWRGPKGNLSWRVKMNRSEHPVVSCSWGWFNWEEFVVGFLWFDGRVVEFCHGRSRLWPVYWLLMDAGACKDDSMPQNMGIVCLQKTTCWWLIGAQNLLRMIPARPTPFLNRGCTHAISNLPMAISRTLKHGCGKLNQSNLGIQFLSYVGCSPIYWCFSSHLEAPLPAQWQILAQIQHN